MEYNHSLSIEAIHKEGVCTGEGLSHPLVSAEDDMQRQERLDEQFWRITDRYCENCGCELSDDEYCECDSCTNPERWGVI